MLRYSNLDKWCEYFVYVSKVERTIVSELQTMWFIPKAFVKKLNHTNIYRTAFDRFVSYYEIFTIYPNNISLEILKWERLSNRIMYTGKKRGAKCCVNKLFDDETRAQICVFNPFVLSECGLLKWKRLKVVCLMFSISQNLRSKSFQLPLLCSKI